MTVRAILIDIEGVAGPSSFMQDKLLPFAGERLGRFIVENAEDEEIEEALDEAGRLMGGFALESKQAEALLLRWMKQGRNPTPLKIIQGRIWQQGYESGAFKAELYGDVAPSLHAWKAAGVRVFTFSSSSELAQKLWLQSAGGDVTGLLEGFFDTRIGQKIEEEAYKAIAGELGVPPADILVLSSNDDELDAAKAAGLATAYIARDRANGSKHAVASDLGTVSLG